jgi:excisionase family DNA binding protein
MATQATPGTARVDGRSLPTSALLLDIAQAAEYLGVTPRFVRALVQQRRVVHYKVGKFVRFTTADLDAFVQAGRVELWRS